MKPDNRLGLLGNQNDDCCYVDTSWSDRRISGVFAGKCDGRSADDADNIFSDLYSGYISSTGSDVIGYLIRK
jgi:hypothetical protein